MSRTPRTCYLFTQSYPYGSGEVFVKQEINYLAANFDEVFIFPYARLNGPADMLPGNVRVVNLFDGHLKKMSIAEKNRSFFLTVQELRKVFPKALTNFRWNYSFIIEQYARAKTVQEYLAQQDLAATVFYSYWFDSWALVLSLVQKQTPQHAFRFYCRAHGFDVFRDQTRAGYHPFKSLMFEHTAGVYSVSKKGEAYLKEQYPLFSSKIHQRYLGSKDNGLSVLTKEVFHIVTCAGVRKVKRIDLIPEILAQLPENFEVKWTLIGDGHQLQEVKEKCKKLKKNISCEFLGSLKNEAVMAFYRDQSVNLFLSVSESEGVPFTMIEAISFGIPLMSTDVGGCAEICNEATGVLMNKNIDSREVAEAIATFSTSEKNTAAFRMQVRNYWDQKFNAAKNFPAFYDMLSGKNADITS
jgi:glycosyltransferase involved in cell wall biosynthesis